ncbi:hypothetical protein lbkm_0877 [Lachnospiraceae bacterium KM106-2]|nr:hypothetical protein lbkm_0877 [Lachnospiraceae bacterium KM106-2]
MPCRKAPNIRTTKVDCLPTADDRMSYGAFMRWIFYAYSEVERK